MIQRALQVERSATQPGGPLTPPAAPYPSRLPPPGRAVGRRARARPGARRAALARVVAAGGLLASAPGAGLGCSLAFDARDYRCEGEGCGRNATKPPGRCEQGDCDEAHLAGGCLGHVTATEASNVPVEQTIALRKLSDGSPVGGVEVRACNVADLYCTEPLGTTSTGADGLARLAVPASAWSGYLEYRAPGSLPALVHFLPEYENEGGALVRVGLGERTYVGPVAQFETLARVGTASGAPFRLDPALGFVSGQVVGCDGQPLAGVIVTLDVAAENTAVIYADEGLPSASLTSTGPAGDFYVGNVPADRFVIVRAHLAENGQALGDRRAVSKAGALTVVTVGPSP